MELSLDRRHLCKTCHASIGGLHPNGRTAGSMWDHKIWFTCPDAARSVWRQGFSSLCIAVSTSAKVWRRDRLVQVVAQHARPIHVVARIENGVDHENGTAWRPPAVSLAGIHAERSALTAVQFIIARRREARLAYANLVAINQRRWCSLAVCQRRQLW